MSPKLKMCLVLSGALLFSAAAVQAQRHGPDGPPPFGAPMELMGFEGMHGGKVVKGAPFSATATSETTSTLQDGTVLHKTSPSVDVSRQPGKVAPGSHVYGLRPADGLGRPEKDGDDIGPRGRRALHAGRCSEGGSQVGLAHARQRRGERGFSLAICREDAGAQQQEEAAGLLKTESFGTQTIDGVVAEGTRTTHTIPAGQIGNEKPLQVVSERWYSADLQIVLKSTRTDPRFGTTTYTVTNLQRTEPAATLFHGSRRLHRASRRAWPRRSGGRAPRAPPID